MRGWYCGGRLFLKALTMAEEFDYFGEAAQALGEFAEAKQFYSEALAIITEIVSKTGIVRLALFLGSD